MDRLIWWCQGRTWKRNGCVSFSYTSHSLGSQFWPARRSWLQDAAKKENQHRFGFSDTNCPLLRNTHYFYMSQFSAVKMKLHPPSFMHNPPAMLCVLFLYNAGSSQSILLQSSGSGVNWCSCRMQFSSYPFCFLCATSHTLAIQGVCEILKAIKASLAKNSVGFGQGINTKSFLFFFFPKGETKPQKWPLCLT